MVVIFPVAKLLVLLVSQVSKPIAHVIQQRAVQSRIFREYFCIAPAQLYNSWNVKLKFYAARMNAGGGQVGKLSESRAIELGSKLLSELIMIIIGTSAGIIEMRRQSGKKDDGKQLQLYEKENLRENIKEVAMKIADHRNELDGLIGKIREIVENRKNSVINF